MDRLQLLLLGPPEVRLNNAPVVLPAAKDRALLYYLAVTGRPHDRSHLAGLLWGGLPEDSARRNLRGALNHLRPTLHRYLLTGRQTVAFNSAAPHWLDVAALQEALGAAGEPNSELRRAVAHYRGEFLHGFEVREAPEFEAWLALERERLRQLVLDTRQTLADAAEARDDLAAALEDVRAILAIDSWREDAHQQLMRLLARSGRRTEALAQFETCRRLLAEALGIEPSEATVALHEEIRAGQRAASDAPPRASAAARSARHALPAETTPFVGRHAELAQIARLVADPGCRLLTLFGPGGIGKTRLALQAARQTLLAFANGVCRVALESVASPDLLVTAIAAALEAPLGGPREPEAQVLDYLRDRRMLLLLDNFEHLVAGSDLLVRLLEAAPGVTLLVTSREALNLYEETLFAVEGLGFPPEGSALDSAEFDAVALFLSRARRVHLGFSLAGNEAAVVEICRLLLGMPLGIELAAGWVRTVPCAEIAEQIAANVGSLATTLRNLPARHRSMVAVFDHSWDLLRPEERQILRRLSVFRGGFAARAARQVAGAARRDLSGLADKALLSITSAGRYDLHPLLKQYAADKLAAHAHEQAESQADHAAYYAAFLGEHEATVKGPEQQRVLQRISAEVDNVRVAWAAAVAQRHASQLNQMVEALFHFFGKRGLHREGADRLGQAVAAVRAAGPTPLLARLLVRQGRLSESISREFAIPKGLFTEGLALARQHAMPVECAQALMGLGLMALVRGDAAQANEHLSESLDICRRAGIPWTMANVLVFLAWLTSGRGEGERAEALGREALAIHRETGDTIGVAAALTALGKIRGDAGQYRQAADAYAEALAICRQNGHRVGAGQALTGLYSICARRGDFEQAAGYALESLEVTRDVGDRLGMAIAYHNLGYVAARAGQHRQAVDHYQHALGIYRTIEVDQSRVNNTEQHLAESQRALSEPTAAG